MNVPGLSLASGNGKSKLEIGVCVGTSCYLRGAQSLLYSLMRHVEDYGIKDAIDLKATFCFEKCDKGPTLRIGEEVIHGATFETARDQINQKLKLQESSSSA